MPELRKDPVIGRWVIIATERALRPSDFHHERDVEPDGKVCPFCPGNESMTPPEIWAVRDPGTAPNTPGWHVRVVPNKFPALRIEGELGKRGIGIYDMMNGIGAHEVIIETPDHKARLHQLSVPEIVSVATAYRERLTDLHKDVRFRYILIFKNQGSQAGASLYHSHSQLIATPVTPKRVKEELIGAKAHYDSKERCVFCDIMNQELDTGSRIVHQNDSFLAFCPFASRFPFEVWLMPKYHQCDFNVISHEQLQDFASALKHTLSKLDAALDNPQYNYVIHTAPSKVPRRGYWETIDHDYHWHIEIMPRLTKVAGFEWGTGFYINPTPPEEAAKFLREVEVGV